MEDKIRVEYLEGKQLTEKSVAPAESLPIDKVVERLEERITEIPLGDPAFADPRYTPINLDTGNFHPIVDREVDCTLCFLDGGNINVARAPNFIVELTRLYFGKYRGGRRLNPLQLPQRIDFYTVCYATSRKGRIIYRVDENFTPLVEQNGYELEVDSLSGGERTSVALAYRLALNVMVKRVCNAMRSNLLILDEPTDGFSREQLFKLRDILDELKCEQVIMVSHERELESFADRVYQVTKEAGESHICELTSP